MYKEISKQREWRRKFEKTPKRMAWKKKYEKSLERMQWKKNYFSKYHKLDKWKKYMEEYRQKPDVKKRNYESGKRFKKNNPEKVKFFSQKYRHAKRARGNFTKDEWFSLLEKHYRKCVFCLSDKNIEIDHIIPVSKGGLNIISNLQPLCKTCNLKKHNKILNTV